MKLLSNIKNDIEFNRSLYNLVDALGKIAVAQYYLLEKKAKLPEKIFRAIEEILAMLDSQDCASTFVHPQNCPAGLIAVTSDTGLLGGLNMQVMNLAAKEVTQHGVRLITIGEKGRLYALENNLASVSFKGISDEESFLQARQVRDYLISEVSEQRLGALKIIYPHPISVISQRVQMPVLLPITQAISMPAGRNGYGAGGPKDIAGNSHAGSLLSGLILESSVDDSLKYLAYIFLGNKLSEIFSLARLAELSARFVHLESSKTKIEQLNKELRLQYFRQKHELTDRNMRELFTARLAFKKGA